VEKTDRAPYADTYRAKARDILAQAEAAADHLIATELRLLAKRYLMLALEIENGRRPRARSRRVTPRPQAPPADPRPSSDAGRGDS
jgi:hypothetical protein